MHVSYPLSLVLLRGSLQTAPTLADLCQPVVTNFIQHIASFEIASAKSKLQWSLQDLGDGLKDFASYELRLWIAQLAGKAFVAALLPAKDLHSGVLGLPSVDVTEFMNRKAVPADLKFNMPKTFDLGSFVSTFFNLNEDDQNIDVLGVKIHVHHLGLTLIAAPVVDAVLSQREHLELAQKSTGLAEEVFVKKYMDDPSIIKSVVPKKLAYIQKFLGKLPQTLEACQKGSHALSADKLKEKNHWKRWQDLQDCCLHNLYRQLVTVLDMLSQEQVKCTNNLFDAIRKFQKDAPLLEEMISNTTRGGKDSGERLGGKHQKFLKIKEEAWTNFFYACATKILSYESAWTDCAEKIKKVANHPAMDIKKDDMDKLVKDYEISCQSSKLSFTKDVLADLLATRILLISFFLVKKYGELSKHQDISFFWEEHQKRESKTKQNKTSNSDN